MRLYEHEAKKVFETMGLKVPKQYGVIQSPADLDKLDLRHWDTLGYKVTAHKAPE